MVVPYIMDDLSTSTVRIEADRVRGFVVFEVKTPAHQPSTKKRWTPEQARRFAGDLRFLEQADAHPELVEQIAVELVDKAEKVEAELTSGESQSV